MQLFLIIVAALIFVFGVLPWLIVWIVYLVSSEWFWWVVAAVVILGGFALAS